MEKIKILHMITHLGVGGAQENTFLTVKGHNRDRYIVHLAAGDDQTDWQERGREYADDMFLIPDLCRAAQPLSDKRALNQITSFLREQKYDIVHTHCAKAGVLGRIAARIAKVPIIIHTYHCFGWRVTRTAQKCHLDLVSSALKKKIYFLIERYAASLSDALITVSDLNEQEALDLGLAPPEKFTRIYSGIDYSRFKANEDSLKVRLSLGLAPDNPVIGTIGRLSIQKAPLDFVAAAKTVLRKKMNAQFVMVGDGPLAVQVKQAIGDENRIKLLGHRDNVPDILSAMDVFALSSLWEGLGRALTEAMIMGVPVAATSVDGVPELVTRFHTGLLSPPGDPSQLAENIIWLLDNPLEAQRMARNAKNRVVPAFDAERMVEQIEALYERLLVKKGYYESNKKTYFLQNCPPTLIR